MEENGLETKNEENVVVSLFGTGGCWDNVSVYFETFFRSTKSREGVFLVMCLDYQRS